MWDAFNYCEIFAGRFTAEECERVISLHQGSGIVQSRIPRGGDGLIRDSDLFWVPRTRETGWVFERLCDVAALYNARYGFELCAEMGQLQLTRYRAGQLYDWHMDLGPGATSLRKITIVVELAAGPIPGRRDRGLLRRRERQPDRSAKAACWSSRPLSCTGPCRRERHPLDPGVVADRTRAPHLSATSLYR